MAPFPDPALKGPQLTIRKDTGHFTLQAHEELSTDAVGLGLQPRAYTRPRAFERILARPPIARRHGRAAMGGADLAVLPRRGKTLEEALEVSLVATRTPTPTAHAWLRIEQANRVLAVLASHSHELIQNAKLFFLQTASVPLSNRLQQIVAGLCVDCPCHRVLLGSATVVADFVRQRPPLGNGKGESMRPADLIVAAHHSNLRLTPNG